MTSLKKPLIAIATALAIATTALTAPASAATAGLTVNAAEPATTGSTSATAIVLPVPSNNVVGVNNALKIALTGITAGSTVTAVATNATLLTSLTSATASSGSASLSIATGTGTVANIFVYTKTTSVGTVVVTADNVVTTYYVKGLAGPAYNVSADVVPTADLSSVNTLTAKVTDVFGNAVATSPSVVIIGGTAGPITLTATVGSYTSAITTPAVAGEIIIETSISPTAVDGFAAPVKAIVSKVSVGDLRAQIKSLSADLASEKTARITDKTAADAAYVALRAKFNALAKKYNSKTAKKYQVALLK
jgi:hypothetical protein